MTLAPKKEFSDLRRHSRHEISQAGTLTYQGTCHSCSVMNASLGGVLIAATSLPAVGEEVVFAMDHMGAIHGVVARSGTDGAVIRFDPDEAKIMGINDMITFVLNQDLLAS